jgi:Mrp family chromosome partitioning ATPase/capsular polysaccharide biosynthesis protein
MLDATKSRLPIIDSGYRPDQGDSGPDKISLRTSLQKVRQRRRMMMVLTLVGAAAGMLAGIAFVAIRVPAFSASSELLISNTTLQLSGPEAVVTQVLLENSLIESAMALLKSGKVLERVIDKLGLEEVERISLKNYALLGNSLDSEAEPSEASRRHAAISLLRSNMTVTRVGASQIVAVRARAVSAIDAARLTDEIAGAFVKDQYDANTVITTNAALRERIKVLGPTVRIISEAAPPRSKDPPSGMIAILLAVVLGGASGATTALALILFDPRLRCAEQLAALTSAECFGYVPRAIPLARMAPSFSPNSCQPAPKFEAANRTQRRTPPKGSEAPHSGLLTTAQVSLLHKIRALRARLSVSSNHNVHLESIESKAANRSRRGVPPKRSAAPPNTRPATAPRGSLLRMFRALQKWLSASESNYNVDLESILRRSILRRVRSAVDEWSTSAPHIIGVTSCRAGEGKSTLAANLARFIAREGAPVLLIDASCPEMTRDLAQQQKPGLQELLRGTSTADKVIRSDICPNLDFLPRGLGLRDIDPLWGNLLHAISGVREPFYKWIILDLPELATDVDVRAAGQVFDDLLIVVEWGRTTHRQLQQGLRALGPLQERIIGTIINKVPGTSIDYATENPSRLTGSSNDNRRSEMTRGEATP